MCVNSSTVLSATYGKRKNTTVNSCPQTRENAPTSPCSHGKENNTARRDGRATGERGRHGGDYGRRGRDPAEHGGRYSRRGAARLAPFGRGFGRESRHTFSATATYPERDGDGATAGRFARPDRPRGGDRPCRKNPNRPPDAIRLDFAARLAAPGCASAFVAGRFRPGSHCGRAQMGTAGRRTGKRKAAAREFWRIVRGTFADCFAGDGLPFDLQANDRRFTRAWAEIDNLPGHFDRVQQERKTT